MKLVSDLIDAVARIFRPQAQQPSEVETQKALGQFNKTFRAMLDGDLVATTYFLAEGGEVSAQFDLGCAYYHGNGVSKDLSQAAGWFRKAAEKGHAQAQYNLGYMYANGEGVLKDAVQAVSWYRKAA